MSDRDLVVRSHLHWTSVWQRPQPQPWASDVEAPDRMDRLMSKAAARVKRQEETA